MWRFKRDIFRDDDGVVILPTTVYSYMRNGSQDCSGFHIPYVVYLDVNGATQTQNIDECDDLCTEFIASSIVSIHFAVPCSTVTTYNLTQGTLGCTLGVITLNSTSPITLYSNITSLNNGVILYADIGLTTLTTASYIKQGTTIYELNSGQIVDVYPIGTPC